MLGEPNQLHEAMTDVRLGHVLIDRPNPNVGMHETSPYPRYTFLTLSTLERHPAATSKMLLGPDIFMRSTSVSQLLQVYGDVFAVLTIPVEFRTGRIYNQEVNAWNWKTGERLCVRYNFQPRYDITKSKWH